MNSALCTIPEYRFCYLFPCQCAILTFEFNTRYAHSPSDISGANGHDTKISFQSGLPLPYLGGREMEKRKEILNGVSNRPMHWTKTNLGL
jgi:hypothetical protein